MFFPERIRRVASTDRVLEIGPGSQPHGRSDVFLDRRFADEPTAHAQRGYAADAADPARTVYYDGGRFPFADGEFDYVICSHVLEHVPDQELDLFVAELQRVARAGYLEFPSVFYELINFQPVHRWLMNQRDGTILLLDKSAFRSGWIHRVYRDLFYAPDRFLYGAFRHYRDVFFCGFEWSERIRYRRVDSFEQLVNQSDHERIRRYLETFPAPSAPACRGVGRRSVARLAAYGRCAWQRTRLRLTGRPAGEVCA